MGTARRQFTDEFKREALASSGRPLSQMAHELGIAASMLRSWRNRGDGGHAGSPRRSHTQAAIPHAGADLAAENTRLRRENERLRMEREILKKNAAHFLGSAEMKFRLIAGQRETFPVRVMCKQMKKYILTASAIAFGAAIFLAAPAYAGEDCLGLSIGPGCIGIDGDSDHQYRRSDTMPAHAHHYVAPNGGQYYYDDDSFIIATEITTDPFEAPLTSGVTKRYASTIGDPPKP